MKAIESGALTTVAKGVEDTEGELMTLFKQGDKANLNELELAKMKYQAAQRTMTLFSELSKNMHEMLMALIRNLKLN